MDSKDTPTKKNDIVRLNVGGVKYDTTRATLEGIRENFFTCMFKNDDSGRITCKRDENGRIFIDRNGKTFAHVLDSLRGGTCLPKSAAEEIKVKIEFDFFGIETYSPKPLRREIPELGKKRRKIEKELDRATPFIEKSLGNAIRNGKSEWQLTHSEPTSQPTSQYDTDVVSLKLLRTKEKDDINVDIDCFFDSRIIRKEFMKRWGIYWENGRTEISFDLADLV